MTSRSDLERVLDRYLAEGVEQVPDRVIDAALDQVDQIPQRRAWRMPWRSDEMPTYLKLALSGAAVIALVVVGSMFLNPGSTTNVGGPPIATPSPSASVAAPTSTSSSPSIPLTDTSNWVAFTSVRYGYEIEHPLGWSATPAIRDWTFDVDRLAFTSQAADRFIDETAVYQIGVSAFAEDMPPGTSEDEWIAAYYQGARGDGLRCDELVKELQPITVTVDGHEGRMWVNDPCSDAQAFIFRDGRVHVFAVWRADQESLLEAFLSTVNFTE